MLRVLIKKILSNASAKNKNKKAFKFHTFSWSFLSDIMAVTGLMNLIHPFAALIFSQNMPHPACSCEAQSSNLALCPEVVLDGGRRTNHYLTHSKCTAYSRQIKLHQ